MKRFHIRGKALLRAIQAAFLAFFLSAGAGRVEATPPALTVSQGQVVGDLTLSGSGSGGYLFITSTGTLSGPYIPGAPAPTSGFTPGQTVTIQQGTNITGSGSSSSTSSHYFLGLETNGTVVNNGTVSVTNTFGTGTTSAVYVNTDPSNTNPVTITNNETGALSGTGTGFRSSSGIFASSDGAITVNNFGIVSGFNSNSGSGSGSGIAASTTDGAVTVNNSGMVSGSGFGSSVGSGIAASTTDGAITVNNSGTISGSGFFGSGINASNSLGAVTVTNSGTVSGSSVTVSGYGIFALSDGAVTITNSGTVSGSCDVALGVSGRGILARGNGAVTVDNSGTVTGSGSSSGYGIFADRGGAVTVTNSGTVSASGSSAYGISADSSLNSLSSVYVKNTGTVTATGTNSYGIRLGSIGRIYNSGTITGGTYAIQAPNGSEVTLAGQAIVNGLMVGGTSAPGDLGANSALHFNLSVPQSAMAAAQAAVAAAQASLAADNAAGTTDSVVINGQTYQFLYFGLIDDAFSILSLVPPPQTLTPAQIFAQHYSQVAAPNPVYAGMANALSNLPSSPQSDTLLNALNSLPVNQLPAALTQLSAAKVSQQLLTQPVHQAIFQNLEMGNRLSQVRQGFGGGADWSGLQYVDASDPLLSQVQGKLYAYNPVRTGTATDVPSGLSSGEEFARWGTFLTGNAVLVNQDATASQNHVDSTTVDITAGADYRLNRNWAVGFLFGYGKTAATVDDFGSQVTDNQFRFGPYVGYNDGPWYANAHGYFAFNDEFSKRGIPVLGETAQAHPFGTQYGADADGGYEIKAGHLTYGPTGGLQYTHLNFDSYTESGSSADLHVASQQSDSLISSLGGKADYDLHWKWNNATVRPELRASWLHEFMGNNNTVGAAFNVPGSPSFTVANERQQRDSALVGAGVQNIFPGGSLLFLDYDAQVGIDNYLAQSITGGFKIVF